METRTFDQLPLAGAIDINADFVPFWNTAAGETQRATPAAMLGGALTGSGTPGRISQWSAADVLGDSTLVKSGAGVLSLNADAAASLTVTGISAINGSVEGSITGSITGGGAIDTGGHTLILVDSGTLDLGGNTLTVDIGTFTPGFSLGDATTGITYGLQNGWYTRIGNRVFFDIDVRLTSKGTATGALRVTGLPFTVLNNQIGAWIRWTSTATSYLSMYGYAVSGTTEMGIYGLTAAATSYPAGSLNDSNITDSTALFMSGSYRTG